MVDVDESYRPTLLYDPDYYKEGDAAKRLHSLGINPMAIDCVVVRNVRRGLFDRLYLYEIDLMDEHNKSIGSLFAKVAPTEVNTLGQPERRTRLVSGPESISYQYRQMEFWNKHNFPTARGIAFYNSMNVKKEGSHPIYSALVMKRFNSPTFDIDILAIDKMMADYKAIEDDGTKETIERSDAKIERYRLRELRLDLIRSALETINIFAVYGSSFIKNPKKETHDLDVEIGSSMYQHNEGYYTKKCEHYLQQALMWALIKRGDVTRDDIEHQTSRLQILQSSFTDCKGILSPHLPLIERIHRDKNSFVYVHGDEFPHHIFFEENGNSLGEGIDDTGTKAKFFDPSYTMWGSLIRSKAAFLTSPILELEYLEAQQLFIQSQLNALQLAKRVREEKKCDLGEILTVTMDKAGIEEMVKSFDLISLFELLNSIGLFAGDSMYNPHFMKEISRPVDYAPRIPALFKYFQAFHKSLGRFQIVLDKYNPENAIDILRTNLLSRLLTINTKPPYKLEALESDFVQAIWKVVTNIFKLSIPDSTTFSSLHKPTHQLPRAITINVESDLKRAVK